MKIDLDALRCGMCLRPSQWEESCLDEGLTAVLVYCPHCGYEAHLVVNPFGPPLAEGAE